jgi:hypothetical protein
MNEPSPPGGPFRHLRWVAIVATGYAVACAVWVVFGAWLPGGRWFAVHLFTLGVVTNLVLGLTDHFSRTLTHQPGAMPRWQLPIVNACILAILWGIPNGSTWVIALGATALTALVLLSYGRLRKLRRTGLAPRFGWVVRAYERAHGAFIHGAVLGALIGTSVLTGSWAASARIAHAHIQLLGWAGMTLLATIVFFGPTVARTRITPGADARAARALPRGAISLTLAVLALLGTGAGGAIGIALRVLAAVALVVFAWSVTVVCVPVFRAMRASRSAGRWGMLAVVVWFPLVGWADVAVVATASWRWLDPLGAALILGVVAQAIVASLGYLGPLLRPRGAERDVVLRRTDAFALARTVAWNAGTVFVVAAAIFGPDEAWGWVAKAGWALVLASAFAQALVLGAVRRDRAPA